MPYTYVNEISAYMDTIKNALEKGLYPIVGDLLNFLQPIIVSARKRMETLKETILYHTTIWIPKMELRDKNRSSMLINWLNELRALSDILADHHEFETLVTLNRAYYEYTLRVAS